MLKDIRGKGDTLLPLQVQFTDANGNPYDLTGDTVQFSIYDWEGNTVLAPTSTGVTVTSPATGEAEYAYQSSDVANAGIFYGYFLIVAGGKHETAPLKCGVQITITDPSSAQPQAASSIDILSLASAPVRTRTVEGTVEERTIGELVKADQYLAAKAAANTGQPWGIRAALTRPSGMVGQTSRSSF